MAAVRQFVAGFNDDHIARAQAACTEESSILDDFPPHEWSGRGATTRWYEEMAGMAGAYGMSDWSVTLNEPSQVNVSGVRAYVVAPIRVRWVQDGTPTERSGFMTMALRDEADGWRISMLAWTWT